MHKAEAGRKGGLVADDGNPGSIRTSGLSLKASLGRYFVFARKSRLCRAEFTRDDGRLEPLHGLAIAFAGKRARRAA